MSKCCITVASIIYATGAFGTHSYIYNHAASVKEPCEYCSSDRLVRDVTSFFGGLFWPVYLVSVAAHHIDAAITNSSKPHICRQLPGMEGSNLCVVPEEGIKSGGTQP